jgi:aspartyl-tRNA(Asn)/glutamyl-tRNA(Gln) amidotransferase subunit C
MEIKDIENLSELAKLDLSQEEKEKILKDLDGILDYVKQIEEVEVENYEEDFVHKNAFRIDEVVENYPDKDIIKNQFGDRYENFVKVKKIL